MLLLIVAVIVGIPLLLLTLGILGTINLHKKKKVEQPNNY